MTTDINVTRGALTQPHQRSKKFESVVFTGRLLLRLKENGQRNSLSLLPILKPYLPPSHAIHVWRTRPRSRCLHLVPCSRILGSTLLCSHRGNTERHSYLTLRTALSSFFSTLFWNAQSNNTSGNHANMFVA